MRLPAAVLVGLTGTAAAAHFVVDGETGVFKDEQGRQRFWHGMNIVQKSAPFYPDVKQSDIDVLKAMGHEVVRLGVMMPGVFPKGPTLDGAYLDKIEAIIKEFYDNGILTIIDLHQDALAPKLCGEGTPDWMLNVSDLHAMLLPRPVGISPTPIDPTTGHPKSCEPTGFLKGLGWSMWYMTDQCGKAFAQLYSGKGEMAQAFERYWGVVAERFRGNPGVLAYELLNEPWVGDHVADALLLLEAGRAEKVVGQYMQRMHDVIKAVDPDTLILYAPAEVNNRAMRRVGYEEGFLPGAGMAYHVYCVVGTDGPGPTNPIAKELCHFNDKFSLKQREADLSRLKTAGFVTEFGGVLPGTTGFAEVDFMLDHFDSMQPPSSWAFWQIGLVTGQNATTREAYMKVLARPYARAVAGELQSVHFDGKASTSTFKFKALATTGVTEVVLGKQVNYPNGFDAVVSPEGAADVKETDYGLALTATAGDAVTLTVRPTPPSVVHI